MSEPAALVLLSGGMDSTALLYYVKHVLGYTKIATIGISYGQRHEKELEAADKIATDLGIEFSVINIGMFRQKESPLVDTDSQVPNAEDDKQFKMIVPGRNAIFLSYACAYAYLFNIPDVFIGANKDDFRSFPDCRAEFVNAFSEAQRAALGVSVYAPFLDWTKVDIVEWGIQNQVPFDDTWSCYEGGKEQCGRCDACKERLAAFEKLVEI